MPAKMNLLDENDEPQRNRAQKNIEVKIVKYSAGDSEATVKIEAGSTLPLMESGTLDVEESFDPFEHRNAAHPTTNMETLMHLLKGSLGSGILAMPSALALTGLMVGSFLTLLIGSVCTYCIHILVISSREQSRRLKIGALSYAKTAEAAFATGPVRFRKFAKISKSIVNWFLALDLLGCCCVYNLFVGTNLKQVLLYFTGYDVDVRIIIACMLPLMIPLNMIKSLKFMAPISIIANALIAASIGITFYYMSFDLPPIAERRWVPKGSLEVASFFGIVIFALEGIGVILPLENNMKSPESFLGCSGVLNQGMVVVVVMYAATGFLGFYKYGDRVEDSITLNLPQNEIIAQLAKIFITVGIMLTYTLQFYVPVGIIWSNLRRRVSPENQCWSECLLRAALVTATNVVSILLPEIAPLISLIGAVCLSMLGLAFPAMISLLTFWEVPGYRSSKIWVTVRVLLIIFGVWGLFAGTYVSIQEFRKG